MYSLTDFETRLLSEGFLEYPSGSGQQNIRAYGKPFKNGYIYVDQMNGNRYADYQLTEEFLKINR